MATAFSIKNVVKTYGDFQLGPLDLELEPGIVLGYIGPNGSGKTTTMHCLTGLVKAESGEMSIFGRRNHGADPAWKRDIGYVGDAHPFYESWTGAQNLRLLSQFYPDWSEAAVSQLARRFALPLDKKVKHLSTGNRVKLSLVAALGHAPKLLLLDEPTAGLDPMVRSEVLDALFEVLEDGERAIFYSTHILSDISRLADELAFLHNGRVVQREAKDALTDRWRRISFRLPGDIALDTLEAAVHHRREGDDHQVISSDGAATLQQLQGLGAQQIQETRMGIEDITVQILKGGIYVDAPES